MILESLVSAIKIQGKNLQEQAITFYGPVLAVPKSILFSLAELVAGFAISLFFGTVAVTSSFFLLDSSLFFANAAAGNAHMGLAANVITFSILNFLTLGILAKYKKMKFDQYNDFSGKDNDISEEAT